jgi:hypothetical protein
MDSRTDLKAKGNSISKTKAINKIIKSDVNEKHIIDRLKHMYARRHDHLKLFLRIIRFVKRHSREVMISFLRKHFKFDNYFLELLQISYYKKDNTIKRFKITRKYGQLFFRKVYVLSTPEKQRIAFKRFTLRCAVIKRKAERVANKTPLHLAKHNYRREVTRFTRKSMRENQIKYIEKIDKYTYNLDHIVPIMYGFNHSIPPELIGNISNLMVIPKMDNIKKRCNINYVFVDRELFKGYL